MDIDLARSFLEIVRTGSFIAAAERLHVTQTTVTARIRNLEAQLGCRLFVRNRSGARLTPDGERFVSHASQLVRTWEAARRELPLPGGTRSLLTLGGEMSLWNPLLLSWLAEIKRQQPLIAVRVEVGERHSLHEKLQQGVLDVALVHQPDYWVGMNVEQLLEEKLIMVRSSKAQEPYVYVDWGEHFCRQHDAAYPELARAALSVDLGPLALQYLLQHGGRGYFRTRVVQPYLDEGLVELVQSAPEFSYPIYVVSSKDNRTDNLERALTTLKAILATPGFWHETGKGVPLNIY
ncbi:MAG: LysR family transcriptional regulator [Porticoccaceae bacterium]